MRVAGPDDVEVMVALLADAYGMDPAVARIVVEPVLTGLTNGTSDMRYWMHVEGDGRAWRALGLGPVAVVPERQRQGIGSALIREALVRAEALGEELVFLVGEPEYYRSFGFSAATAAPFASPYAGPYFMALALREAPLPATGKADYAPAFASLPE